MEIRVRTRPESDNQDVILENVGTGERVGEIRIQVMKPLNAAEYTVFWQGEPVEEGTYNFQEWNDDRRQWMLEKVLGDLSQADGVLADVSVQEWV